jgi:hypothetical protein
VKHVTVNADQAMVADNIVTGNVPRTHYRLAVAASAEMNWSLSNPSKRPIDAGMPREPVNPYAFGGLDLFVL